MSHASAGAAGRSTGRHAGSPHPDEAAAAVAAGVAAGAAEGVADGMALHGPVVLVLDDGSAWRLTPDDPRVTTFQVLAAALGSVVPTAPPRG